jgi:lysophospholipase L1-like esterase
MNKKTEIIIWLVVIGIVIFGGVIFFGYRKPQTVWQYALGYAGYNKPNAEAKSQTVFLGDSITARENWNVLFGVSNIFNAGFPGDTTDNILARLDLTISAKPKKIFLMMGANDLMNGQDSAHVLTNYEKVLDKIKIQSPETQVYVQSLLPVNNDILKSKTVDNKKIILLNGKLKLLAQNRNLIFIDLYPSFSGIDNKLPRKYAWDGLHPNTHGYTVWKGLINQDIR